MGRAHQINETNMVPSDIKSPSLPKQDRSYSHQCFQMRDVIPVMCGGRECLTKAGRK